MRNRWRKGAGRPTDQLINNSAASCSLASGPGSLWSSQFTTGYRGSRRPKARQGRCRVGAVAHRGLCGQPPA